MSAVEYEQRPIKEDDNPCVKVKYYRLNLLKGYTKLKKGKTLWGELKKNGIHYHDVNTFEIPYFEYKDMRELISNYVWVLRDNGWQNVENIWDRKFEIERSYYLTSDEQLKGNKGFAKFIVVHFLNDYGDTKKYSIYKISGMGNAI